MTLIWRECALFAVLGAGAWLGCVGAVGAQAPRADDTEPTSGITTQSAQASDAAAEPAPLPPPAVPTAPAAIHEETTHGTAPHGGHAMLMHGHAGHGLPMVDAEYRSPGLAVALSLTPLPVDFGNLYAENLAWGVAYTGLELALMIPMMVLVGSHMDHGGNADQRWSSGEQVAAVSLVSVYVLVKLVAGLQAGAAARSFNADARGERVGP